MAAARRGWDASRPFGPPGRTHTPPEQGVASTVDVVELAALELRDAIVEQPLNRERFLDALADYEHAICDPLPIPVGRLAELDDQALALYASGVLVGLGICLREEG